MDEHTVREQMCVSATVGSPLTAADHEYTCPTGTTCLFGRCMALKKDASCQVGQVPFMDVSGNGVADSCSCPSGFISVDKNGDGNADSCLDKGPLCSVLLGGKAVPDAAVNTLYDSSGTLVTVYNYCDTVETDQGCGIQTIHHVTCGNNEVQSSSTTTCGPGYQCLKGICAPTGGGTCDATMMDLDPTKTGYVVLTDAQGNASFYADQCNQIDPTIAQNASCGTSCNTSFGWVTVACPAGHLCNPDVGSCVPVGGGGTLDDGVNCTKTPNIPECLKVDCKQTPNDPKCQGPSGKDDPDCPTEVDTTCGEDSDPNQDPFVFGEVEQHTEITSCNALQDILLEVLPEPDVPDLCVINNGKPVLYQFGCKDGDITTTSTLCDPAKKISCDAKAEKGSAAGGVCKPFETPTCVDTSPDPNAVNVVGAVSGVDGYGHEFEEQDACEFSQGLDAVVKFSCDLKSPLGYTYDFVSCPKKQECVKGKCVPITPPDPVTCAQTPDSAACKDSDGDGIVDALDNCPQVPNPLQEDANGDGIGDACEKQVFDTDKDGLVDPIDNCPFVPNPDQDDSDSDGIGDACENVDCTKPEFTDNPMCVNPDGPPRECEDDDKKDNLYFKGSVFIDKNKPGMEYQSDYCVDNFTAVVEVGCGPQGKSFVMKKYSCPGGLPCKQGTGRCTAPEEQ